MWYAELVKPWFAPSAFIFAPVWTVLYIGIIISFGYVFYLAATRRIPLPVTLPFVVNVVANLLYTPVMFGLRDIAGATIVILFVLGSLLWAMRTIFPYAKWVAYLQVPYLLWVLFATVLQISILVLN